MPLKKLLACAIFILLPLCCLALDPEKAITQYVHDVWTSENGLPENEVNSILQTRDRYLWVATYDGFARFDGNRFMVFNKNNTILETNMIQVLLETRDGTLWIGSVGAGLYSVKNGNWKHFSRREGLTDNIVISLSEDREGTLWIGTRAGLNRLRDGKLVSYPKEGFLSEVITALYEDSKGNLWIAGTGLHRLTNGKFTSYTTSDGLSANEIRTLYEDRRGNLWIGTDGGGINKLKDGKFTSYSSKEGLSNNTVNDISEDRDGNLWIATASGINRMKDEIFSSYSSKEGLSDDGVLSLHEDVEGSLWIGTAGGLNRLKDGKFSSFTMQEGLLGVVVWSVFEDHDGNVWIGTNAGLNKLKDGKITSYSKRDGLSGDPVSSVYEDTGKTLWIGIEDAGLNRISNGKFTHYTPEQGLSGKTVLSLYEDRKGNLWIGTTGGLSVFQHDKLTSIPASVNLPRGQVRSIYEDTQGNLWIGMLNGLSRLKDGNFTRYTTKDGLSSDLIVALYADSEGSLWIGTTAGLDRLKDGKLSRFTTKDGLHSDAIAGILEDDAGNLWFCSAGGIFNVRKKDVNEFAEGKLMSIESTVYSKADGIKSGDCKGGQQPSSWKTRDGKLWFATSLGAAVIDPRKIHSRLLPPPVMIESIIADSESVWSRSVQSEIGEGKSGEMVRIAPGKDRLEFHFTAPGLLNAERVKFRFMLEGLDSNWAEASTRRVADYTHLPPGEYKFKAQACNEDGVWNEADPGIALYCEPLFYQTYWFYGICLLAIASVVAGGHRLRVRQLEKREQELIAAVQRGTQDLRDANKRLQQAEDRILEMADSGPEAFESIAVWSKLLADDIARVIGAREIGIWRAQAEGFFPLVMCQMQPPAFKEVSLSNSNFVEQETTSTIPIKGSTGGLFGVMVVAHEKMFWSDQERHLVATFANRLAATFEMEQMREKLAEVHYKKTATLQEMHDRGIATLQLCPVCRRCYDHTGSVCEADGAHLTVPRVLPHRISDRYRLMKLLGEGGMGAVFKAHDEKLRRDVSLKIIRAERLSDETMRFRINREAQILAQIQHPGVISIYDFGELSDGSAFMVMEYLEGEDLQSILKREGPGTPQQIAMVLQQVGEALNTSHGKGVVHRDLKPSNLFVVNSGSEFQVKVLDFGLAKSVKDSSSLTATGLIMGTPAYMSPEQAQGQVMNEQSDLFSLASLTYELLSGKPAFKGESVVEVLSKIILADPEPLSSVIAEIPEELDTLFSAAMARKGADRPQNLLQWTKQVALLLKQCKSSVPGWRT